MIDRVKMVIAHTGLSDRAFALKCGINQPTLFNQLKGLRQLSLDTIKAIALAYPEISGDWLLTGVGEMIRNENKEADRVNKLIDTITTLQDALNEKSAALAIALERIRQLENQIKY